MPKQQSNSPAVPAFWVYFCAFCHCAGWILSAFHRLDRLGYSIAFGLGLAAVWFLRDRLFGGKGVRRSWQISQRRFRRLFPLGFLILAALALLGGALHAPNNYDALVYRTPRVLHWLAEGRWHWIHTDFGRLNNRGCGIEWVTAPLLLFTRGDRALFLVNAISFLLLPGRVFALLTRLGVRPRVAWQWMWLMPTGYCYLLQAASIGNDLFGSVLAMTAIEFALRSRPSGQPGHLMVSILAAGLMTAGKAFNLLLLLPWLVAAFGSWRLLFVRPAVSVVTAVGAAMASLVPSALMNLKYCGDWTGLAAEQSQLLGGARAFHIAVNTVLLLMHNFAPPVFPLASAWNHLMTRVIPAGLAQPLSHYFEPAGAHLQLGEMQTEEWTGLGFGLSILLAVTVIYRLWRWRRGPRPGNKRSVSLRVAWREMRILVPLATYAAAGVFMAQSGFSCPARYLSPFYVVLLAPVLAGGQPALSDLVRRPWWRRAALAVFLLAGLLLIVSPARPLWPAVSILRGAGADHATHPLVRRAWTVYSVYGARSDSFAPAKAALPPHLATVGFVSFDDPETSLWRPFGSRRILHVCRADRPAETRRRGIQYILLSSNALVNHYGISLEEWLRHNDADLVQRLRLELRAGLGPTDWYLVKER